MQEKTIINIHWTGQ